MSTWGDSWGTSWGASWDRPPPPPPAPSASWMLTVKNLTDYNFEGTILGQTTIDKIAFYGKTPIAQRAAAIQAASVVSAASYISVTSNLAAFCAEVAGTLTALGLWKGSE